MIGTRSRLWAKGPYPFWLKPFWLKPFWLKPVWCEFLIQPHRTCSPCALWRPSLESQHSTAGSDRSGLLVHCARGSSMSWSSSAKGDGALEKEWWGSCMWWRCTCTQWNESAKKKCSRCGVKKAWAAVAHQHQGSQVGRAAVQHQGVPVGRAAHQHQGVPVGHAAHQHQEVQDADVQEEKNLQMQIRDIDVALGSMPQGEANFVEVRSALEQKKEQLKRSITTSKPLVAQIESCSGAVIRAQRRVE